MSDDKPAVETPSEEIDVTNAWQASQDQKGKAKKLRLMAVSYTHLTLPTKA